MSSLSKSYGPRPQQARQKRKRSKGGDKHEDVLNAEEIAKVNKHAAFIEGATQTAQKSSSTAGDAIFPIGKKSGGSPAVSGTSGPTSSEVLGALGHLRSFADGSTKAARSAIVTATNVMPSLVSFLEALDQADRHHHHAIMVVRALEIIEVLLKENYKCMVHLVSKVPNSIDVFVRILGGVRDFTKSWEGMLVLDRICVVLLHVVSVGDESRDFFVKAKGGAALRLAVDILCSMAKRQSPEPIYRRGFDVSADSWVQLAKRVCALVVETAASEKMSNKSNLRSLHKAGVFGSLCRLLKTLMRRSGEKTDDIRGPSPLLRTQYSKELMLAIHALLAGERDYQRTFLNAGIVPSLIRELFRSWVYSWLGATIPEVDEDGEDSYLYFGSPEEAKRIRTVATDAYSKYAGLHLLLAALQYDFTDASRAVENSMMDAATSGLLEKCVITAAKDVGGSALESYQYEVVEGVATFKNDNTNYSEDDGFISSPMITPKKKMSGAAPLQRGKDLLDTSNIKKVPVKITLASGVTLEAPISAVTKCSRWYATIMDESRDLHLYHYDEEACVESLNVLERTLQEGAEVRHFFVNIRGAVELLVQNVNQIDENVMRAGCAAAYSFLLGNSVAQKAFLRRGGVRALADCLHDYDIKVRLLALQSIAILCSKQEQCLDEVRKTGILKHVISILNDFPADDVNVDVAIAAADVLAHCVNDNVANQELVQGNHGLATLRKVFEWCVTWRSTQVPGADGQTSAVKGLPASPRKRKNAWGIASVLENVCSALSNLAFRNQSNQNEMLKNGTLALCISTLCNRAGTEFGGLALGTGAGLDAAAGLPCRPLELTVAILNIIINGVDANPDNQVAVGVEDTVALLSTLIGPTDVSKNGACGPGLPLFRNDEGLLSHMSPDRLLWHMQRVAAMSCLLLSHLAWDNPATQAHLGNDERVMQLVFLIDTGSEFGKALVVYNGDAVTSSASQEKGAVEDSNTLLRNGAGGIFSVDEQFAGRDEVRLYALMALINLCYHNLIVQNIVNGLRLKDGRTTFDVILSIVSSELFDVRKAAVFCLDNLVTSHRENSRLLAEAGGVLSLVALLNDDDEDEISKKAFRTLTSMSDIALSVILSHVAALCCGIEGVTNAIGAGLAAQKGMPALSKEALESISSIAAKERNYYLNIDSGEEGVKVSEWEDGLPSNDAAQPGTQSGASVVLTESGMAAAEEFAALSLDGANATQYDGELDDGSMQRSSPPVTQTEIVWGMLGKLLPVVNGIVYNDVSAREFLWQEGNGLPILLFVVTRVLPLELRVICTYILANITQTNEKSLQILAFKMGAFSVLNSFLKEVDRNDDDSDGEDGGNNAKDTISIIFTVLHNLLRQNFQNAQQLSGEEYGYLLKLVINCCADGTEPELRNDAANVLLAIVELALEEVGPLQNRLLDETIDAAGALQIIGESFDSSLGHAMKARAEQAARGLRTLSGELKK
jgi:hypothetical protein